MERQVSNFLDKSLNPTFIVFCSFFLLSGFHAHSQGLDEYVKGKLYTIDTITVSGIKTFSDQTRYSIARKTLDSLVEIAALPMNQYYGH